MVRKSNDMVESVVFGRNPVLEALERGATSIDKVYVQKGGSGEFFAAVRRAAAERGVPVQYVPKDRLQKLAGKVNHQGVVALRAEVGYQDIHELLAGLPSDTAELATRKPLFVYLDRVTDPHNFGAVVRSAAAFGCNAVLVPSSGSAPLNGVTVKASAGMALRIPICRIEKPELMMEEFKERGYWIVGADGAGEGRPTTIEWTRPTILLVGSEGGGLSPRLSAACDDLVSIPIVEGVDSLNVSVATAILLYEASKPRIGTS